MSQSLTAAVRQLRRSVAGDEPDAALLGRYATGQDADAFAALVRRYRGLVFGVCRRVLRHEHDAEDATQATFLVLAHKARSVRRGESLPAWLHGTARHVALRARRQAQRRRTREGRAARPLVTEPADELSWREVHAALDEEIARLPDGCRGAFLLCCLEGTSHAEAARRLGIAEGAVASRLTRARRRLYDRLKRRGVELSAVLAAASVARAAPTATADAVVAHLAGTAELPATVLTLATGATRTMLTARTTLALLLLVGGLLGAVVTRPPRSADGAQSPRAAAGPAQVEEIEIEGRVLGPDGRPLDGARVGLWESGQLLAKGTRTRGDGGFRLTVRRGDLRPMAKVVATADGLTPDWASPAGKKEVVLRLGRDSMAVEGRIVNLEGQPVAGLPIELVLVGKPVAADPTSWFDRDRRSETFVNLVRLESVQPRELGLPQTVTTDRHGRFRIQGLGPDRVVEFVLRGETTRHVQLRAATRALKPASIVRGPGGLYGASFSYIVPPGKAMVGVVRDHRTGKPIAGARLATVFSALGQARTNERGEFRLAGLPKRPRYAVDVFGPDEASYLSFGKSDIPDTPGVDPVRIDFEMERGVMVRGRVVEKGTGRPVLCSVKYQSRPDNPRLKDFPTLSSQNQQHWGLASGGPDGRFSILVLPGPGVLVVSAGGGDETRPPLAMTAEELAKWKVRLLSARPVLAVADIDPDEADPKSLVCDLVVERRKAP